MSSNDRDDKKKAGERRTSGPRIKSQNGNARVLERVGRLVVDEHVGSTDTCEVYRCFDAVTGEWMVAKVLFLAADTAAKLAFAIESSDVIALARTSEIKPPEHGKTTVGPYYAIEAHDGRLVAFMLMGC